MTTKPGPASKRKPCKMLRSASLTGLNKPYDRMATFLHFRMLRIRTKKIQMGRRKAKVKMLKAIKKEPDVKSSDHPLPKA